MAKHCKEAIVAAATGDLSEKSALDFACGPGTVTLQVAPLLKEVVGADISTGMVEEYGNQVSLNICQVGFDAYDCSGQARWDGEQDARCTIAGWD